MSKIEGSSTREESMTLGAKGDPPLDENKYERSLDLSDVERDALEKKLLDDVANSKATFKSQLKWEHELTFEEKRAIAEELLEKRHCLFLSRFGHYMKVEHLRYFSKSQDYETIYHVNRLRRYFNNAAQHIDVKNKRYEALKALIEKGEYFSECEMMKRNPLLYEHLVGQYLTEEERKARDSVDTKSANYVDILMEMVERNKLENHLKSQQKEEDEVREENDSDDDDDDSRNSIVSKTNSEKQKQWGEEINEVKKNKDRDKRKHKDKNSKISNQEIKLLRQEFITNMYQSFLDGKDTDFDYRYMLR